MNPPVASRRLKPLALAALAAISICGLPVPAPGQTIEVVPLAAPGVWWIGAMTVAVTDTLRSDASAFDDAIHPIIAELA